LFQQSFATQKISGLGFAVAAMGGGASKKKYEVEHTEDKQATYESRQQARLQRREERLKQSKSESPSKAQRIRSSAHKVSQPEAGGLDSTFFTNTTIQPNITAALTSGFIAPSSVSQKPKKQVAEVLLRI
jgi:hypothetical protein